MQPVNPEVSGYPMVGDDELSSEDIMRVRQLGLNDLYFFTRGIMAYQDVNPRVHRALCDFLSNEPAALRLILMPRSHFKTTVGLVSDTTRHIARNPNIRVLLANESSKNAQIMLEQIKLHFTNNPRFRLYYDYLIPKNFNDTTWSKEEILVPRTIIAGEPTIMTIGVGGAVVSRHFDLFKFDDLIGEEALSSPTVMAKAISWLNHSKSLYVDPTTARIDLIGTRWSYSDLYAHAISKMGFKVFRRKAVIRNLATGEIEPLFNQRFSLEWLSEIMRTDPAHWAAQYANDPSDVAWADFQKQWLRWYKVGIDGNLRWIGYEGDTNIQELNKLTIYTHVDPSMGDSANADECGVITVGVNSTGQIFLLDAWSQRVDPLNLIEKIFEIHDRFSPKLISIESTAFQKSLHYYLIPEMKRRGVYLRIEDYKPSTHKSKPARIRGALQPYFSSGQIFVRESQIDFVEQYMAFGRTNKDHLMDALAQGPEYWKTPKDDIGMERHKRITTRLHTYRSRGIGGYGI